MSSENIDLNNTSAFMVHHIMKHTNPAKRRKKLQALKRKMIKQEHVKLSPKIKRKRMKNVTQSPNNIIGGVKSPVSSKKNEANCEIDSVRPVSTPTLFDSHFQKKSLFQWMINPLGVDDFMRSYWESKPLHLSSGTDFSMLLSTPIIDEMLTERNIQYTKNIDITFYSEGVKELHNLEGRARPHVVWDFYVNKCSIRLLNPQTFVPNIHKLASELQELFGCFVGCNAYLTPPHSQGFAPHYDDIEAFILQLEGKKRWRVYKPRSSNEELPRFSSGNFTDDEIGEPILDIILNVGDVLYLPRGYIHQATTVKECHSLHITISAYQRNAWIDLIEKALPNAMEKAWKNNLEFRKGLPIDYLKAAGLGAKQNHKGLRSRIQSTVKSLIYEIADYVNIDSAVDQLGVKFLYDALPPVLTEDEKKCSVFGGGLKMIKNGTVVGFKEFNLDFQMEIVLLRHYVSRFVKEKVEDEETKKKKVVYRLYYTTDNSLEYHGEETSFLIIPKHFIKSIQFLFQSYPDFVAISELPYDNSDEKMNLVADLWERGIIRTKTPVLKTS